MNFQRIFFLFTFFVAFNPCYAKSEALLKKGSLIRLAPPIINKDYFLLEYGFIIEKSAHKYDYNAYVTASLFEEYPDRSDRLKSGALGIKAGVLLPIYVTFPLSLQLGGGYAKSVLHPNPIFGKNEQTASKNNMLLLEAGLHYRIHRYSINVTYQRNTIDYFSRKVFVAFGVNY